MTLRQYAHRHLNQLQSTTDSLPAVQSPTADSHAPSGMTSESDELMVTVRVDVNHLTAVDVTIPGNLSVAELIPQLLDCCEFAPKVGTRWLLYGPRGKLLNEEQSLCDAGIVDGQRLELLQHDMTATRFDRDVAETLATDSSSPAWVSLLPRYAPLSAALGLFAACLLGLPLPSWPTLLVVALIATVATSVSILRRGRSSHVVTTALLWLVAGAAVGRDTPWIGMLVGSGAALTLSVVLVALLSLRRLLRSHTEHDRVLIAESSLLTVLIVSLISSLVSALLVFNIVAPLATGMVLLLVVMLMQAGASWLSLRLAALQPDDVPSTALGTLEDIAGAQPVITETENSSHRVVRARDYHSLINTVAVCLLSFAALLAVAQCVPFFHAAFSDDVPRISHWTTAAVGLFSLMQFLRSRRIALPRSYVTYVVGGWITALAALVLVVTHSHLMSQELMTTPAMLRGHLFTQITIVLLLVGSVILPALLARPIANPSTVRVMEIIEIAVTIIVIPLLVAGMGVYSAMRGIGA